MLSKYALFLIAKLANYLNKKNLIMSSEKKHLNRYKHLIVEGEVSAFS